jgi:GNAT superfamily N-acetyltransferase
LLQSHSTADMNRFALAKAMKEVTRRADACWRPANIIQHQFAGTPFGSAYVCISPGEQAEFASSNGNRVHLCGTEPGLTADGIAGLQKLFADAGIGRYFVWISPGPDIEVVRRWLADAALTRRPYVSYLTLARDARESAPAATGFDVREVDPQEVERLSGRLDGVIWPEYLRSLGVPGVHHFMAFEGERPVASAVLCIFEELGYLSIALTAEPFRRRGAQRALIAERIKKAGAVGCKIVVSETLSILEHSLGNLQKAGFEVAYEDEVYGVFADNEPRASSRHAT